MQSAKLGVLQRQTRGTREVKGFFPMDCKCELVEGGHCIRRLGWAGDKAPATRKKPASGGCKMRSDEIVGVIKRQVAKGRLHYNGVFMEVCVTTA